MSGEREYAALTEALLATPAPCRGDERYIRERHELTETDAFRMRGICRTCPVRAPCASYAAAAKPLAGMWAGELYPRRTAKRPTRKET